MTSVYFIMANATMRRTIDGIDIHDFLSFRKPIFADSGGFTQSRYDLKFDQTEILAFQEAVNCDAAATLDYPLFNCRKQKDVRKRIGRTIENIAIALDRRTDKRMMLYGCVHGRDRGEVNDFLDTIESNGYLQRLDGLAIGSVEPKGNHNDYLNLLDIIRTVRSRSSMPCHLFGMTGFRMIPFLLMSGCDSFDSKTFAHASRFRMWIDPGSLRRIHISRVRSVCYCKACKKYSISDYKAPGSLGASRIAEHNFEVYISLVKRLKGALVDPVHFVKAMDPCINKFADFFRRRLLPQLYDRGLVSEQFLAAARDRWGSE